MKSKLKILKSDVLVVITSKAHKQLSDAVGNEDKVLADFDGKVPEGDQKRNSLTKALESVKKTLQDRKSVLKAFLMPKPIWMSRSRLLMMQSQPKPRPMPRLLERWRRLQHSYTLREQPLSSTFP